jgi:hypothetical protein
MTSDAPTKLEGIANMLDTSAEQLAATALLAVTAFAKAWQTYNDRPGVKRGGRRSSDPDSVAIANSQSRIEKQLEELTTAITVLTDQVRARAQPVERRES